MSKIMIVCLMIVSTLSLAQAFDHCDGPPWDPCELFSSDDVPDNQSAASSYIKTLPQRVSEIHNAPLTIDKLDMMGFLGDANEKSQTATYLEFLMWEAGFDAKGNYVANQQTPYAVADFYNHQYGDNFSYFLPPFDYKKGWKYCQALKFRPTVEQIQKAQSILQEINDVITVLTTKLPEFDPKTETSSDLVKKNRQYYDNALTRLKTFNYETDINYAQTQFDQYMIVQNQKAITGEQYWINQPCLKGDSGGSLTVYNY